GTTRTDGGVPTLIGVTTPPGTTPTAITATTTPIVMFTTTTHPVRATMMDITGVGMTLATAGLTIPIAMPDSDIPRAMFTAAHTSRGTLLATAASSSTSDIQG